jgi:hypothetical protein
MTQKPTPQTSSSAKELDKAEKQFEAFDNQVKNLNMDAMNRIPKPEVEPQTKMASSEIAKSKDIYLKPAKSIGSGQKFNEDYRSQYEFDKEYVQMIAENKEIIGETIEMWTRPYGGMPAEFWQIPVNKPVWAPRYVAEQLKRKFYHRLQTQDSRMVGSDGMGSYHGCLVVDTTIQRLDAHPVSTRKSIFMGATAFG